MPPSLIPEHYYGKRYKPAFVRSELAILPRPDNDRRTFNLIFVNSFLRTIRIRSDNVSHIILSVMLRFLKMPLFSPVLS